MPEGPECKIVARELSLLRGLTLKSLKSSPSGRYRNGELERMVVGGAINSVCDGKLSMVNEAVLGNNVEYVASKGKLIYIKLSGGIYLLVTLGMTGTFSLVSGPHTSVIMEFGNSRNENVELFFNDQRHFGTISVGNESYFQHRMGQIGDDIFDNAFNTDYLKSAIEKSKPTTNICVFLMNQKNCAGLGNYIKSEALYLAEVHPMSTLGDLNVEKVANLVHYIKKIARDSFSLGGMSMRDFVHLDGTPGEYFAYCNVYGKKVTKFGDAVKKIKTPDGRSTWYV